MSVYHVFRYWSPTLGGDAARVMLQREDGKGGMLPGVWWKVVAVDGARGFRESRDRALDEIEAAIARGAEPGEVS